MDLFETLEKLTGAPGPSGMEGPASEAIRSVWDPFVDEITVDRVGSLLALKKGQSKESQERPPRLLLAAHMDEIALMVKDIAEYPDDGNGYGFLKVTGVGGVDRRHLYGQRVTVHGKRQLPGLIGALPSHMQAGATARKAYSYEGLVVDVGLPITDVRDLVSVGDFVSFHQPLRKLLNKRAAGKALDNRTSVLAVAVALEYLSRRHHAWDVVAVATAQEETGLLGAYTSAYAQRPDVAIAVDVTFGKGPGAKGSETFELDGGPVLGQGPNVHPGVFKELEQAASTLEMEVHTEPHPRSSGTDAYGLQIAREGIPTGLVSIPLRYMHTMVETVALADVERAGRLLGEFAARLDEEFLDKLAEAMMKD